MNSIELFKKNAPELLDKVYKSVSTTADFDINGDLVKAGANANEIIIPKLDMDGLGDFDRNGGYLDGDINLTNETVKFNYERGRKLKTDIIDNEETGGVIMGNLSSEFLRNKVVPEIDAVRYATYASLDDITDVSPNGVEYENGESVLKALQDVWADMTNDEVPEENRYLRITSALLTMAENVSRITNNDILKKFAQIKVVPQNRFLTKIELRSGKDADGERIGGYKRVADVYEKTTDTSLVSSKTYYTKSGNEYTEVTSPVVGSISDYYELTEEGSKDINFMVIHKPAMLQYTKHAKMKIFTPDSDDNADNYRMLYRIYGLNDAYENKRAGIAVSHK